MIYIVYINCCIFKNKNSWSNFIFININSLESKMYTYNAEL